MATAAKNVMNQQGFFKPDYFFTGQNFFDFVKTYMNVASGSIDFPVGTIGILVIVAGAGDTVQLTARGTAAAFQDIAGLLTITPGAGQPGIFLPCDCERVACSGGAAIQICVISRSLRQYE